MASPSQPAQPAPPLDAFDAFGAFEAQARTFGFRAGLPPTVCHAAAEAVVDRAPAGTSSAILDVGAGTGDVGLDLAARCPGYRGIDLSPAMLAIFRARSAERGLSPDLAVADARVRWPVTDGSLDAVFGSRSLHFLDADHLASEVYRVAARAGAVLLVGRVLRDERGPRDRIRREMVSALREAGLRGRGYRGPSAALRACEGLGAAPLPEVRVAAFAVEFTPRRAIEQWREKPGLDGIGLPAALKAEILARVERFAARELGDVDAPLVSEECYVLGGVSIPPRPRGPSGA